MVIKNGCFGIGLYLLALKELIVIHISSCYNTSTESLHDREVAPMIAFEIISIFIGILALLMSFGSLIVALLAFLDKSENKNTYPACQ